MSRWYSYLNSAVSILNTYDGDEPLAAFLKKYFAQHKKYGSGDRKQIAHICYGYFRLGKAMPQLPVEERVVAGLFLNSTTKHPLLELVKPEWNEKTGWPIEKKYSVLNNDISINEVFPWEDECSEGIDQNKFCESFFIQPDLFLRLRPGKAQQVKNKLGNGNVEYKEVTDTCLALPNASKVDELLRLNEEVVVQDYSSQQTGTLLAGLNPGRVWDCCAASGGKSIMAWDVLPPIELTVSDKRESIISNLKKRFREAGIDRYQSSVIDLSIEQKRSASGGEYPLIIADVPCTGSGTWSRTPEQLFYFEKNRIDEYASLQKKIMMNVVPCLQTGGHLLYITCSVFKKENEEMVEFLQQQFSLAIIEKKLLKGYTMKADTMFAALLRKEG
ncbi:MAG TPA: Fmu (Sun) domain-containing protein [Chitinophagaceae bacterium]|jgi:16S rRNA (cytosine967-C5)-methyltransferase|nr:Fmu (Sun) domain-containing protein [Chitinophagaceae bacterium]